MVFCVTAISIYVLPYNADLSSLLLCGLLLPFTGPVCNLAWLFAGVVLKRFFGKYHKTINILMGLLLLFCAASILDIL
jgi:cysteine/O-acetylserine efflux protein